MDVGAVFKLIIKYCFKEILEYLQEYHFDAALAVIFVACVVYYYREELYSQGIFTWTNLGLEFTWTELGLGLLIEFVFLVLCYIAGFFPRGEFIWYTCCLLIVLVLGVFIVAKCIEVNLPTRNETPNPEDRSTSQKENESPSPGQRDSSDTIDGVMLPSQNETHKSEDRSASQKENKGQSPGQSNARSTNNGRKFHRTILNCCMTKLLQDLDFRAVYPCILENNLFDEMTTRDISEQKTSGEKNLYLIDRLKERDEVTYAKFKECLVSSGQEHLKKLLEQKEEEVDSGLPWKQDFSKRS